MLRVVFFGSAGGYSATHLSALVTDHRVVGVFCALGSRGARKVIGRVLRSAGARSDACSRIAHGHGIPLAYIGRTTADLAERVASLAPDVICVAGYPWLLPATVWRLPPLGALNAHPSLLPRHRGVLPLFWIYHHDDRTTGVTVHRVNETADGGEIICQDAYPLERGFPVEQLNHVNASRGGLLLQRALAAVSAGQAGTPQDDEQSTSAPFVRPGTAMVDSSWDVERVWHFLAGLFPRFIEPLRDADGRPVDYGEPLSYERTAHDQTIGIVRREGQGCRLYCAGGVVTLGPRDGPYSERNGHA